MCVRIPASLPHASTNLTQNSVTPRGSNVSGCMRNGAKSSGVSRIWAEATSLRKTTTEFDTKIGKLDLWLHVVKEQRAFRSLEKVEEDIRVQGLAVLIGQDNHLNHVEESLKKVFILKYGFRKLLPLHWSRSGLTANFSNPAFSSSTSERCSMDLAHATALSLSSAYMIRSTNEYANARIRNEKCHVNGALACVNHIRSSYTDRSNPRLPSSDGHLSIRVSAASLFA